jgi:hypothetical protein
MLQQKYGLDVIPQSLRTVSGKAAARTLETRYIRTYEKIWTS